MDDILPGMIVGQPEPAVADDVDGLEDDRALAQVAKERPAAFAELYRRHLNRVYRYLLVHVEP